MPVPRPLGKTNYRKVWERDYGICQYCGFPGESIDHIIPWAYQPNNSMDNLVVACMPCNRYASASMFSTFQEKRDYVLMKRRPEIERQYLEHQIAQEEEAEERVRAGFCSAQDCAGGHEITLS